MYVDGGRGSGLHVTQTYRDEQGGRGIKNWEFRVNMLFEYPASKAVIHGLIASKMIF